jgi:L-ribulose-5-phosphate 3-epimerase
MLTRREFLHQSLSTTLAASALVGLAPEEVLSYGDFQISIFSKHLHWLDWSEMASLAKEIGFDAIDLTVRPGGHVSPENVKTDLAKACQAIRRKDVDVSIITTNITSADDPLSTAILRTAAELGITHYRMGWIQYDQSKTLNENLKMIAAEFTKLEELNQRFNMFGDYQNHAGNNFGSSIWDLHKVLSDIKAVKTGCQFDIQHATVEGANSWRADLELIGPHIHSVDVKDFKWKTDGDKQRVSGEPLGEGVVDFNSFFKILKRLKVGCPITLHFEYPLGGIENGERSITISRDAVVNAFRRDLTSLKRLLAN